MSQYLLLRDNKQSGPYTFEELTAKGLKGYDLIWIEGKSAAWRYPSEIQEFKPYAPLVEEQPYDRFYKRQNNTPVKAAETAAPSITNTVQQHSITAPVVNNIAESESKKNYSNLSAGNRRVVVILPGGMKDPNRESVVFHETVENKIATPERKITGTREPVAYPTEHAKDPAVTAYRKDPVITVGQQHKKAGVLKSRTPKILAGTVVLLTIGVLIGWAFSTNFLQRKAVVSPVTPAATVPLPASQTVFNNESSQSVENQASPAETPLIDQQMPAEENQTVTEPVTVAIPAETILVKKPVIKHKKLLRPVDDNQQPSTSTPVVAERTTATPAVTATDNEEAEKKAAKKNINELIKVSKNEFKIGAFGGISNLQLKVTNSSPYPVDLVVVEVKYLLANKKEFKTENIYFKNLPAGTSVTKEAPKSSRGIEVTSKVALITSKALGMYQASL